MIVREARASRALKDAESMESVAMKHPRAASAKNFLAAVRCIRGGGNATKMCARSHITSSG